MLYLVHFVAVWQPGNGQLLIFSDPWPRNLPFDGRAEQWLKFCNRLHSIDYSGRRGAIDKQRIPYVDPESISDSAMREEFERCRTIGTPRPESQAIRAHVPAAFWSFANTWRDVFHNGVADHAIKELCRVYVSHSVKCEYCGNQRSIQSARQGLVEDDYLDLLNFERSARYDGRQKAALRYTEAIVWDLEAGDSLWQALYDHYTHPEIVEIGFFVAITMGQQRWLRTLNIDHHQVLAGTDASMMPGAETAEAYESHKESDAYWARNDHPIAAARKPPPADAAE